jgi:bacterioferritin-associated ferredoxin
MYVCICNAISERSVRDVAARPCSVAQVFRAHGAQPQCGRCVPHMRAVLAECANEEAPTSLMAEAAD